MSIVQLIPRTNRSLPRSSICNRGKVQNYRLRFSRTTDNPLCFVPAGRALEIKRHGNIPDSLLPHIDRMQEGWMPVRTVDVGREILPEFQTVFIVNAPIGSTYQAIRDIGEWAKFMAYFEKSREIRGPRGEVLQELKLFFERRWIPNFLQKIHAQVRFEYEDNGPAKQIRWQIFPKGFKKDRGYLTLKKNTGSWTLWPLGEKTIILYQIHTITDVPVLLGGDLGLRASRGSVEKATLEGITLVASGVNNRAQFPDWTKEKGGNPGAIEYHT